MSWLQYFIKLNWPDQWSGGRICVCGGGVVGRCGGSKPNCILGIKKRVYEMVLPKSFILPTKKHGLHFYKNKNIEPWKRITLLLPLQINLESYIIRYDLNLSTVWLLIEMKQGIQRESLYTFRTSYSLHVQIHVFHVHLSVLLYTCTVLMWNINICFRYPPDFIYLGTYTRSSSGYMRQMGRGTYIVSVVINLSRIPSGNENYIL